MDGLTLTPELRWLAYTSVITAFFWVPYILDELLRNGPISAMVSKRPWELELAEWAQRARRAHWNQIENLAVFGPLALAVAALGASSAATATAAVVFFYARLVHYVVYTLGIPVLRTLAFLVGVACQLVLAWAVLAAG